MTLALQIVPCLADNYAWIIHDEDTGATAVVDVPDAEPILTALDDKGWTLDQILITHHHDDHIAGVPALVAETGAKVIGAAADAHRLPPLERAVDPGTLLRLGATEIAVMDAPGHTVGHIAYYIASDGMLFSGDSLMSWGCGRLFEGTPAQMFDTLERFRALPPNTRICSGHEYTEANGRFALSLETMRPALLNRMEKVRSLRQKSQPTLPATLEVECATNPFLRSNDPALKAALGLPDDADPLAVFTETRALKDRF